jgi:hypothetical protein
MWRAIALGNLFAAGIAVHVGSYGFAVVSFGAFLAWLKET